MKVFSPLIEVQVLAVPSPSEIVSANEPSAEKPEDRHEQDVEWGGTHHLDCHCPCAQIQNLDNDSLNLCVQGDGYHRSHGSLVEGESCCGGCGEENSCEPLFWREVRRQWSVSV